MNGRFFSSIAPSDLTSVKGPLARIGRVHAMESQSNPCKLRFARPLFAQRCNSPIGHDSLILPVPIFSLAFAVRLNLLSGGFLRDQTGVRQGLLPARESLWELGRQLVRNFFERGSPIHQLERSAAQEPFFGLLREVICR